MRGALRKALLGSRAVESRDTCQITKGEGGSLVGREGLEVAVSHLAPSEQAIIWVSALHMNKQGFIVAKWLAQGCVLIRECELRLS